MRQHHLYESQYGMLMLRITTFLLLVFPILFLNSCLFAPQLFDEEKWRLQVENCSVADLYAPHQNKGVFFNPWMKQKEKRIGDFLKWRLSSTPEYTEEEKTFKPDVVPNLFSRIHALPSEQNFIVWIGHATFLFRLNGIFWLTDPMLSDRALLPRRITPPALTMKELANFEGKMNVIISHNHYDHLDSATLKSLPQNAHVFVPLGLKKFINTHHHGKVTELDWWQEIQINGAKLTSLPAQHWSRRIGQPVNSTLWASYMIESGDKVIYYGGDSGYFIGYREFARKFPPIDIALLPTTAYQPRWFMHYAHMDITEAIQAFVDLQANTFVPTQWGTFHLGDNPPGLPRLELDKMIEENQLDPQRFIRPQIGEIINL